ncbi:Isoquinoline 1-oxidoreductase subunit [Sphingomonas spermidinifaciens]|uniref:Isoquinoline 1-oxidoreductase subunit n=2 Tax=Sphingomonas spermidinifaciens TaxID=1141889 RepID=A0A2A4B577_9SPHN|nr:Isoquinoline 1-oxidoreductase subunit [Sphingomonas spermidinifaciens]
MILFALIILIVAILLRPLTLPKPEALSAAFAPVVVAPLKPVSAFNAIVDPAARSVALFQEAGRVIRHPRCMNCHPRTDRPTQTDAMRPHMPAVARGPDGAGDPHLRCATCHNDANFTGRDVPGNPQWLLALIEQAWQGRSLGETCRQLFDPARSYITRAELLEHMANDALVGWAWHPGGDRPPAPGTQAQFGALIAAWRETDARWPA